MPTNPKKNSKFVEQFLKEHLRFHKKILGKPSQKSRYPIASNISKVGTYPGYTNAGAGYFYDAVLEYRVWIHPEMGGKNYYQKDDYFVAFSHFEDAVKFSKSTKGAEPPMVLVLQKEWIAEPEPGHYVHKKHKRMTEWKPKWLKNFQRSKNSIKEFLQK
jgi:hypothetical protein